MISLAFSYSSCGGLRKSSSCQQTVGFMALAVGLVRWNYMIDDGSRLTWHFADSKSEISHG